MKLCLKSLTINGIQIKIIMKYDFTLGKMAIIEKTKGKFWLGSGEKKILA
jgi:hypothetical protein